MEKEKITDKIFLYRNSIGCFSYLIEDEKKILIDCGIISDKPVDLVVITHCHYDHILFLKKIKETFNCKVACGERDSKSIETLDEITLKDKSPIKLFPVKVDAKLREGDIVKSGKYEFTVMETPGHTPGSISLFEKKYKILFSGDTWFGGKNTGKWSYPGGNKKDLVNSLSRLEKLEIKFLLPGHWGIKKF
jgi:hydroxyacylglutathione hydrolase